MPHQFEISGIADQGDRGRVAAAQPPSRLLVIENLPDDEGFRVAPGLVVVAAEGDETIEDDIPRLYIDDVEFCPLHERAQLVKAADQEIGGASRLRLAEQLICIDIADRTGVWRAIERDVLYLAARC